MLANIKKMNIKNALLDEILRNPTYLAAIFLLMNPTNVVTVSATTLEFQLKRKYKVAKQSIVIVDYLRSKGYKDSEIFEN